MKGVSKQEAPFLCRRNIYENMPSESIVVSEDMGYIRCMRVM